jgi:hypothetical protein
MGTLINYEAASAFLNDIDDPIVQTLVRSAYQTLCMSDAIASGELEGQFDLLFFFRVMRDFLRDRESLAKALMNDFGEDKTGWGS